MNNGKLNSNSVNTMVKAAFLIGISIVLTRIGSIMILPTIRAGFGEVPLVISGYLFGPVIGGISGLVADLIGFIINPQGPYHPGFTLSSILWGVIPGITNIYFKKLGRKENLYSFIKVLITITICIVIISLGLDTYFLSKLYGKGFIILLPGRALTALINIPLQSYIITLLMKYLKPFAPLN